VKVRTGVLVLVAAAVLIPAAVADANGQSLGLCTYLAAGVRCPSFQVHPSRVVFGADGRVVLVDLKWRHWEARTADAVGKLRQDSGAAGHPHYSYSPARVAVSDIGMCEGRRAYRAMTLHANGLTSTFGVCTPRASA
jgi:hypothetical protein